MNEGPTNQSPRLRRLRFSLRRVFVVVSVIAVLSAWSATSWRRAHERWNFVAHAGAVNGHERTMQGFSYTRDHMSIKRWLFGEVHVDSIQLYPGTFDDEYMSRLKSLFPEAEVTLYRESE